MSVFAWIVLGGVAMSAIALVGSATFWLRPDRLERLALPLVAFAAGNFLYIAASDLVPELKTHQSVARSVLQLAAFIGGLALVHSVA